MYKLTLAYDGTRYGGWQIQKNALSIQALVQDALTTILKTPTQATGAGRTDAGVHALGQVAHFVHAPAFDLRRLLVSLNGLLPPDVRALSVEQAPHNFHARYSARAKTYHYRLHLDRVLDPFKRLYCAHILHPVNVDLLEQASKLFLGTHDFTSFANEAHQGCAARKPIKTIHRIDLISEPGGLRLEFEGDGFLYKMVRTLVGTLLEVSSGKRSLHEIPEIFAAKDRRRAGKTAPPQGLFLAKIDYDQFEGIAEKEGK